MAVFFRLVQNKNYKCEEICGKYYARSLHLETVSTDELAYMMQQNCTLKRSDIVAVISELVDTMTHVLQNGKRVRLDGLGTFKIGLTSKGVSDPHDFLPEKHITGAHILFYPATHIDRDGVRHQALLWGTMAQELPSDER